MPVDVACWAPQSPSASHFYVTGLSCKRLHSVLEGDDAKPAVVFSPKRVARPVFNLAHSPIEVCSRWSIFEQPAPTKADQIALVQLLPLRHGTLAAGQKGF